MPQYKKTQKAPERSERARDTWNSIKGIISIYGNTFPTRDGGRYTKWSASLSHKLEDGSYERYYLKVRFVSSAKAPENDGLQQYDMVQGFLTCETSKDSEGNEYIDPVLIISDGSVLTQ